jgi:hypothetical protein
MRTAAPSASPVRGTVKGEKEVSCERPVTSTFLCQLSGPPRSARPAIAPAERPVGLVKEASSEEALPPPTLATP